MQHWWREVAQQISLKQSSWLIKAYVGYSGNPEVPICLSENMEYYHEDQWACRGLGSV